MFTVGAVGFLLGFFGSVPVAGPISVLVFARGLKSGFHAALGIALGGALAEGVYAFLAFWGCAHFLAGFSFVREASHGITAAILFGIGIVLVRKRPSPPAEPATRNRTVSDSGFFLGFTISLLNPTLLLTWMGASQAVLAAHLLPSSPYEALPFSLGATAGIVVWFSLILAIIAKYRTRFRQSALEAAVHWVGWAVLALAFVFASLQLGVLRG